MTRRGPVEHTGRTDDGETIEGDDLRGAVREDVLAAVGDDAHVRVRPASAHLDGSTRNRIGSPALQDVGNSIPVGARG